MRRWLVLLVVCGGVFSSGATVSAPAQSSSSASPDAGKSASRQRSGQPEAGGAAITLETSETLFDLAAALNACGYDTDLQNSNPVRAEVRAEMAVAMERTQAAGQDRDALCGYIAQHRLSDKARELAQYVSLALYTGPPPQLALTADQSEMPPDALQVVNVLPLLRRFDDTAGMHAIWLKHRAEYEAVTDRVHDPITQMVLATNIYLKVPVSSYDGRRLLILVEPMLSPAAPNARIYANEYIVVTSPTAAGAVRMDEIRHLYLHYEVEPLVYARAQSMLRLTPLLKPVAAAPLDYIYKSDVVALVTECLIKAIEARTLDVGLPVPQKPTGTRARLDLARYDEELAAYDRRAEVVRRQQVDLDMRQGWVLVDYFYRELGALDRNPQALSESIGQMVYGMDVDREQHRAEQISFLPEGSGEFVRRAPRVPTGLALAEKKLLEGDLAGADELADKALTDPKQDRGDALYVKARVMLLEGDPEASTAGFENALKASKNPSTRAWSHIYLGRLFDTKEPAERTQAVAEYKAALAVEGVRPDARAAAEKGLKTPFTVPKTVHRQEEPIDPSGKAEKDSYKPE